MEIKRIGFGALMALAAACLLNGTAYSQTWVLVDDFEADAPEGWTLTRGADKGAFFTILEDPNNSENGAFHVDPGVRTADSWAEGFAVKQLPLSIGPGQEGWIYWRAYGGEEGSNWYVNLSDLEAPDMWSDHLLAVRTTWESEPPGALMVHDVSSYEWLLLDGERVMDDIGVWREYWVRIDYDVGVYEVYMSTDGWTHHRLEMEGGGFPRFRRDPEGPLTTITIASSDIGFSDVPLESVWRIDDIQVANSSEGQSVFYGPYVIKDDWINAADLFGWAYVGEDAENWLYSSGEAGLGWIYLPPEHIDDEGAWMNIVR